MASIAVKGFTIVELLIVIVVIAILAAISVVAYNNIQDRAWESRAATLLSQARKDIELRKVQYGAWPFEQTARQAYADAPRSKENAATQVIWEYIYDVGGVDVLNSGNTSHTSALNMSGPELRWCYGISRGGGSSHYFLLKSDTVNITRSQSGCPSM